MITEIKEKGIELQNPTLPRICREYLKNYFKDIDHRLIKFNTSKKLFRHNIIGALSNDGVTLDTSGHAVFRNDVRISGHLNVDGSMMMDLYTSLLQHVEYLVSSLSKINQSLKKSPQKNHWLGDF